MVAAALKVGAFASLFAILISIYVRKHLDDTLKDRLTSVLQGLVEVEQKHSIEPTRRVAVGYGGCHDLFVNAEDLLDFRDSAKIPEHFNYIKSYDELLKTYAYFFRHGAAAERFVENDTLFYELVEKSSFVPGARFALGGNAPVMASRFLAEGCDVLLGAQASDQLSKRLPEGIKTVPGVPDKEDVHLIMEYKTGEEWGIYTSPRANRFIVHSDSVNPMVSVVEDLQPLLEQFKPHLFVVGGLQMMDNFPFAAGKRKERLKKVREQMISMPEEETRVHFEMASFTEVELVRELTQYVLPFADSLGMNEQELTNLHQILLFGNISLVSDSNPRVAVVLDQMRHVFKLVRDLGLSTPRSRTLTRLHVHTLAYQAIITVMGSPWKNSMAAAAKASLTANRHVCGSTEVDVDKAMLIMDESFSTSVAASAQRVLLDDKAPVSCWEERWPLDDVHLSDMEVPAAGTDVLHVQICVAPVLVCTEAQQTAGGGDNISSAGLVLQI